MDEGAGEDEVVHTRVYFLDRLDGEGSMIVKQSSDLAAAREAFVLLELSYSAGVNDDGAPPCFPTVFGSLVSRRWSACALSNFEGAVPLADRIAEEPSVFNETGVAFDILDRLLIIVQQMQGAGVTHRGLLATSSVVLLSGDIPAVVGFEHAVAKGMAFPMPALPPHISEIYTKLSEPCGGVGGGGGEEWGGAARASKRVEIGGGLEWVESLRREQESPVDGEVLPGESDIYALGRLLCEALPVAALKFRPVLEVMMERWRPERITHVQSLRLLLGSMIEQRADLIQFSTKILTGRSNYFDQKVAFPGNGVPHNNLGSVYFDQQLLNDALALFRVALPLALPFKSGVRSNIAAVRKMMCHWEYYWEDAQAIVDIIDAGGEEVRSIRNLYALALNLTMSQHVAISAAGAEYSYGRARKEWLTVEATILSPKDSRMVLAYLRYAKQL